MATKANLLSGDLRKATTPVQVEVPTSEKAIVIESIRNYYLPEISNTEAPLAGWRGG